MLPLAYIWISSGVKSLGKCDPAPRRTIYVLHYSFRFFCLIPAAHIQYPGLVLWVVSTTSSFQHKKVGGLYIAPLWIGQPSLNMELLNGWRQTTRNKDYVQRKKSFSTELSIQQYLYWYTEEIQTLSIERHQIGNQCSPLPPAPF